jgi:hypothetical protein
MIRVTLTIETPRGDITVTRRNTISYGADSDHLTAKTLIAACADQAIAALNTSYTDTPDAGTKRP